MTVPNRNYKLLKKLQLFMEFPYIWLSNLYLFSVQNQFVSFSNDNFTAKFAFCAIMWKKW